MPHPDFIQPRYDQGGFASLPGRIRTLLSGPEPYDAVILILIDGLGWRFYEKFQDSPFLKRMSRDGQIEKLTSQFPSTTSAHLTTIHTGLSAGQHGIFEWYYWEPQLNSIIAPLLFSFSGTRERDTLKPTGIKPQRIFPKTTLYRELKKLGIGSTVFQHREYTPSTYSRTVFSGAVVRPYRTFPEALVNLGETLSRRSSPAYFFMYFDKVDTLSHEYGPESPQVAAEIESLLYNLEASLSRLTSRKGKRTHLLLTADHGHVEVNPLTTVYINRDEHFAGFERYLKTDPQGNPLVPAGSCRDFFLYIREGLVDEAQSFLSKRLEGRAEVHRVEELIQAGYFGPDISAIFRAHAGDLVILPYQFESVWWYEKDKFEQRYYGHHGGLTRDEMEIPLIRCDI